MADKTINFNPIKFAGGLTKSFVSATMQSISSYMPFTSDVLSDASDKVFNIKQYIAENRPDRTSRNTSGVLRMMANKTLNASRTFLSDLSHGDISFTQTRQGMIGYLKKNTQSEFDFDFDFDFDDENNENTPEERQFTVEDYAEGVYESTMATVGAIEASTNKMALMQAKSNNILGDRLIANNMTSMAQTMQMLSTMNENISGVNTNLASLVEYNNTTMNDFIKNTTTHFAKVESFMDMISKRYEDEDKRSSGKDNRPANTKDNRIFTDSGINFGNLIKKAIVSADTEFGTGGLMSAIVKTMAIATLGKDRLPDFLRDLEGQDLSSYVEAMDPSRYLVQALLPGLGKLTGIDNSAKALFRRFRQRLSTDKSKGGFFDSETKIGSWLIKLFKDRDDDFSGIKTAENKKASWMTSDSDVLQSVIPTALSETNVHLNNINSSIDSVVDLLEVNTKTFAEMYKELSRFHADALKGYKYIPGISDADKESMTRGEALTRRRASRVSTSQNAALRAYRRASANRAKSNEDYKKNHTLIYNADEMKLSSVDEILEESTSRQMKAYGTGIEQLATGVNKILTRNGDQTIKDRFGDEDGELEKAINKVLSDVSEQIFMKEDPDFVDYDDHSIDPSESIKYILKRLYEIGVPNDAISDSDIVKLTNLMIDVSKKRMQEIRSYQKSEMGKQYVHRAGATKNANYNEYSLLSNERIKNALSEDKWKEMISRMSSLKNDEDFFHTMAFGDLDVKVKRGQIDINSDVYARMQADAQKRFEGMMKDYNEKKSRPSWFTTLAHNPINMYASALFDTVSKFLDRVTVDTIINEGNALDHIKNIDIRNAINDINDTYQDLVNKSVQVYDGDGNKIGYYEYDNKNHYGFRRYVTVDGTPKDWEEDPDYKRLREKYVDNGEYDEDPNTHSFYKDDDGNRILAPEQWHSPASFMNAFASGATRIDHDQVAQVHKGEMILDRSLSETVRDNIANMIKAGGVSKLSDDQYKELIKSISDSDERYKGHEEEVIKDINRAIDQYDIKDITKVELSKESVCLIDVDENETFSSLMAKKLTEIAINLGIMTRSTLNRDAEEVEADNKNKAKKGGGFLFGSKNDQGMYTDGFFSKEVNRIKDEFNYWRFSKLDGKEYTGYTRDKAGNIIEGSGTKKYTVAEDDPETLLKTFRNYARQNAANFADKQGFDAERKKQYLESIDRLVDGVPGALKGGVAGLALSAVFGGFAPAIGMLGGFAFSNKETKEFIFGKTVTDENGRKHVEGGLFGGFMNKLTEMGDEIKYNFKTIFSDTASNVKLGLKHFIDKLTNTDNDSIKDGVKKFMDEIAGGKEGSFATKLLSGILNTTRKVAEGASDIAIDSITIGSKLMFKAASLPFNAFASIIGGKGYRDEKNKEKRAARSKELRGLYEELMHNDALLGIDPSKDIIGNWLKHRDRLARNNAKYIEEGRLDQRSLFGKGGKLHDEVKIPNFLEPITKGIDKVLNAISGDFGQNALRGLASAILATPLALTGHPVLAATVLGTGMSNAISKQIFGTGILDVASSGLKMLGQRISTPFKRAGEFIGNRAHFLKESLGIHDNKFYIKRMTKGSHLDKANILGDLGYSPDEQKEYFELMAKDPSELTGDEKGKIQSIREDIERGYRLNSDTILDIKAKNKRYDELRKRKKDLTPEEKEEYENLKRGVGERRWDLYRNTKLAAEQFKIKHGYTKKGRLNNLAGVSLDDYNNAKAIIDFNSTLTTNITDDMFKAMGVTDKGRQIEVQKEMNANLKKVRDQVISKYGSLDAAKDHPEELKDIIMNSALAKNEGAFKDRTGDEIVSFLRNGGIEKAQQEQNFRDKISTEVTDIHTVLNTMWESLKNTVVKFFEKKVPDRMDSAHSKDEGKKEEGESKSESTSQENKPANANTNEPDNKGVVQTLVENIKENAKERVLDMDPTGLVESVSETIDETSSTVDAGANIAGSKLSGAMNIPADAVYQLHAGEMVLDPKTAEAFRQNIAGGGGGMSSIFESMRDKLGGLLNVFTGDKSGSNNEDKMSFLDKMKASVANVGENISGTVMGSGLIPLKANGQIDIAKIVARLTALVGGIILLGPTIGKLVDKIKPYIEPIFETITGKIGDVISNIPNIASDILSGISSKIKASLGLDENAGFFDVWGSLWQKQGQKWFDWLHKDIMEVTQGNDSLLEYMKKRDGETKELTDVYTNEYEALREAAKHDTNAYNTFRNRYGDKVDIDTAQSDLDSAYEKDRAMAEYEATNNPKSTTRRDAFKQKYGVDWSQGKTFEEAKASQKTGLKQGYIGECSKYFEAVNSFGKTFDLDFMDDAPSSYYYNLYKVLTYAELSYLRAAFDNKKNPVTTNLGRLFIKVIRDTTGGKFVSGLTCSTDGQNTFDASLSKFSDSNADNIQEACARMQARSTAIHNYIEYYNQHKVGEAIQKNYIYDNKYNLDMAEKHVTTSTDFWGAHSQFNTDFYTPEELANHGEDIYYGYMQNDPRWSRQAYGSFKNGRGSTLGAGGCGPTAMANVYTNLTGRNMNPAQMARFSQANGYNAQGGTSAGLFTAGARKLGLASNAISKSGRSIRDSIRSGKNVIIAGKNGPYTRSGHIMSVRGVDSRGNAIVDDPLKRGARRIPMRNLTKGMTHAWSIGYGEETGSDGQQYSIWNDKYLDGEVTFNRNGGAFGYFGPNVGGPWYMDGACIYNSFVNGYVNALLGKNGSISDFVKRVNWTPSSLYASGAVTNYNGSSGVTSYSGLAAELEKATGMRVNYIDLSDPKKDQLPELYNKLYTNLNAGNPILFSSNNGTSVKMRDIISSNAEHYAAGTHTNNPMHGVLLAGLYKDKSGNEFVVIDNPNTGRATSDGTSNQFYSVPLDYFKNAVLSSPTPDIHRVVVFDKSGIMNPKSYYESLLAGAQHDSKAHDQLIKVFGQDADKYSSYDEFMQDKYSNWTPTSDTSYNASGGTYTSTAAGGTSSGSAKFTNLKDVTNDTTVGGWFATLIDKFTQFGSNLIGAALSGDISNLFNGQSSGSAYDNGGSYSGGSGSGGNGGSGYDSYTAPILVIDAAYVKSLIDSAYQSYGNNTEINGKLGENGFGMYSITASNYQKITSNPAYQTILMLISSSSKYKEYVVQTISSIYTWVLALQVAEIVKSSKSYNESDKQKFNAYKAMINHVGGDVSVTALADMQKDFGTNAVNYENYDDYILGLTSKDKYSTANNKFTAQVDQKAAALYSKFSSIELFIMGTPTSDYSMIPSWAKDTSARVPDISGTNISNALLTKMIEYIHPVISASETGVWRDSIDKLSQEDLRNLYYNAIRLPNEKYVTIGRGGFYGPTATSVFNKLTNPGSPLTAEQKTVASTLANMFSNTGTSANEVNSLLSAHQDLYPYLMSAEDAKAIELVNEYFARSLDGYKRQGLSDPRAIILSSGFAGVSPARVNGAPGYPSWYRYTSNTPDQLNQLKATMVSDSWTMPNAGSYGKGWENRITGIYNMLTTDSGYYPNLGKYLPLPSAITSAIPSNMNSIPAGYGDAGYNMRDNVHMYTDDVYMGDADNPMHVVLDQSPVTSRIDKLIELVDSAVNSKPEFKAGPSDAISSSIGTGPETFSTTKTGSSKGATNTAKVDKLAQIHSKIAKRTRVTTNYNYM